MVNYTIVINESIKVTPTVIAKLTRNPTLISVLIWLMFFVIVFLSFIFVLQKLIECWAEKKKKEVFKRYLFLSFLLFLFLIFLLYVAIHYSSFNLLKPISDWFGIPYTTKG